MRTILYKHLSLIFLFLGNLTGFSQSPTTLEIKDSNFYSVLDTIVDFEKRCDYYNPDLFFFINIQHVDDSTSYIIIGSGDIVYDDETFFGCFIYQGHLFFVSKKKIGLNPEILFSKTNKKQKVKVTKRSKGDLIILDDSFTVWSYWYKNKEFIFESMGSACGNE